MDRRLLTVLLVVLAAGAIVLLVIQSQNLSQTQGALETARADATRALDEAAGSAATAQAVALAEAADAAATAQSAAVIAAQAVEATAQSQALSQAADEAATAQAQALSEAADEAATAQAQAASTATVAQGEAQEQADFAATQAAIASDNAATATVAQGEAQLQADNAATQAAESETFATAAAISGAEVVALQEQLLTAQAAVPPPTAILMPGATPDETGVIPGWQLVEGDGFTIQLPEAFFVGDPERDLEPIMEQLQLLGPEFEPFIEMLRQNPDLFVLIAIDLSNLEFATNVLIGRQEIPFANLIPMQTYLDLSISQLPATLTVVESSVIEIAGREAGRLIIDNEILLSTPTRQVQYTFLTETAAWFVTYTTTQEEWEARLPIFEKSVETFLFTGEGS